MTDFSFCKSVKKLEELSKKAIDLADPYVMTPERVKKYQQKNQYFELLYATERVNDEVLEALEELVFERDVFGAMAAMQSGEVVNSVRVGKSENRRVLHTAVRDFFHPDISTPPVKEARELALAEVDKLKEFTKKIDDEGFSTFVQIGIGGSELGPKAIFHGMKKFSKKRKEVYFISNLDPDSSFDLLEHIDLEKTLFISVSKSGTTLESLTNEEIFRHALKEKGLDEKMHMAAVTMKNSPMDNKSRYREVFYLWDFIGGRFSVTSMVGGVVISLALGFDLFWELLKGANFMDKVALQKDVDLNLPLLAALLGMWNRNFLHHLPIAVIPYSDALCYFPAHLQQVDMESSGKAVTKEGKEVKFSTGGVLFGEVGTNSQHSFFQMLHQGTEIVPVEFIGFQESQLGHDHLMQKTTSQEKLLSNLFAQSLALAVGKPNETLNQRFSGNRPNHILLAKKLTPFVLGALLAFYEHKVAFQGFLWGVNSFDQEGVELGKVLAKKMMNLFSQKDEKVHQQEDFFLGKAFMDLLF